MYYENLAMPILCQVTEVLAAIQYVKWLYISF